VDGDVNRRGVRRHIARSWSPGLTWPHIPRSRAQDSHVHEGTATIRDGRLEGIVLKDREST